MLKNKINKPLFAVLFTLVLALNIYSTIYPQHINKIIATFTPIPLLVISYFNRTKTPNYLYMLSFLFMYLGATFYILKIEYMFNLSLFVYTVGLGIYIKIIVDKIDFYKQHIILFLLISFVLLAYPACLFIKNVSVPDFLSVLIYGLTILLFFYTTALLVIQKGSSTKNTFALIASGLYIVSTVGSGFLMFVKPKPLALEIITVTSFWVSHLFMNLYMILRDKRVSLNKF